MKLRKRCKVGILEVLGTIQTFWVDDNEKCGSGGASESSNSNKQRIT